jgi:hypothetical protein
MPRTIEDWLAHARETDDAAERARCVDAAAAQASHSYEWRALLAGVADLAEPAARLAEVARRTLEAALGERDVWGVRAVAAIRVGRLGDGAGARAALEAAIGACRRPQQRGVGTGFTRPSVSGALWVILGRGFLEILGDAEGLRRCLELGRDQARGAGNADHLCSIATEWAQSVDRGEGIALLREAESLTANARAWTIANAWHALGEAGEVARVLDAALAAAASCRAAIEVVRAWASHRELARARASFPRAEALAATGSDWLALAEAAYDAGFGEEPVRRALERAAELAEDDPARAAVAHGYLIWLGDEAAASGAGVRGVRPESLRPRLRTLDGWESSASVLFDWLRARVPPETLVRISQADYGIAAEEHLSALRDICGSGLVPADMPWEPLEVLGLYRWSSGERVDHLGRALCALLLCLSPGPVDDLSTSGPILVESCLALGPEAVRLGAQALAWLGETAGTPIEGAGKHGLDPDQGSAQLCLLLLAAAAAPDDPRFDALASRLCAHPSEDLAYLARWIGESTCADLWAELLDRHLAPLRAARPAVAALLAALGR